MTLVSQKATIVVDLGFGDAGKGSMVDYLTRKSGATTVVRFNGGAQAAHNVVTPDGRHHTFAQFGSGAFVPGTKTHLSRFMLVDPTALMTEARHLFALGVTDVLSRTSIDRRALIVTPFHKAANRIREALRGSGRHGSCGMGIGETMQDCVAFPHKAVVAGDLADRSALVNKFRFFQKLKFDEFQGSLADIAKDADLADEVELLTASDAAEACATTYFHIGARLKIVSGEHLKHGAFAGNLIFEGAQGVLIDEWHGFHPYTTWSTTTFDNAHTLLSEIGFTGSIERIGILRAYHTRHGAGPFPTEDAALTRLLLDQHNGNGRWQGDFRIGWFDLVAAKYALSVVGGVDSLVITNLDRVEGMDRKMCTAYILDQPHRRERLVSIGSGNDSQLRISNLKKKSLLVDLAYQDILTRIVQRVRPVYVQAPRDEEEYVRMIERELNTPILTVSRGPTTLDKRSRISLLR